MKPLALAMLGLCACGSYDVVVADVPALSDGGTPRPPGKPCDENDQCRGNELCAKSACDAVFGRCEPRPEMCPPGGAEVCGCDGVSWASDCARRLAGVAASNPGSCP